MRAETCREMTGRREPGERWRGGRSRRMEEGVGGGGGGGGGESSRPSSFRASVRGLVRRVSQKVTRENKGRKETSLTC